MCKLLRILFSLQRKFVKPLHKEHILVEELANTARSLCAVNKLESPRSICDNVFEEESADINLQGKGYLYVKINFQTVLVSFTSAEFLAAMYKSRYKTLYFTASRRRKLWTNLKRFYICQHPKHCKSLMFLSKTPEGRKLPICGIWNMW